MYLKFHPSKGESLKIHCSAITRRRRMNEVNLFLFKKGIKGEIEWV